MRYDAGMDDDATPQRPKYEKRPVTGRGATKFFTVVCNEGWRESIVGTDMYEWCADWLIEVLDRRPFAPNARG